jgi:toxin ParE1/3/4
MPGKPWACLPSPRAEADLEEIWLFTYRNWSIEQADGYHAAIVDAFDGLATGRKTARIVDVRDGFFKYAVGSYLVFYRFTKRELVIVPALHQRMDVGRHLLQTGRGGGAVKIRDLQASHDNRASL